MTPTSIMVETPAPNTQFSKLPEYQTGNFRGLAWRFSGCDTAGPFAWTSLSDPEYKQVIEALHEFEKKNWNEILATGSHPIEAYRIDKSARDRLVAIEQDDIDELMSFRLTGKNRVWCIRTQNIMRVIWWDPEHQVYPTPKDKADRGRKASQR